MKRNFAAFILSHGRADRVLTYEALRKHGYTGTIYIIVDNEDKQLDRYIKIYGEQVIVFDKTKFAKHVDACDNYDRRNSVVYARNYNFIAARKMGLTHFVQLDDDYTRFSWSLNEKRRYVTSGNDIKNLDLVLNACLDFIDDTPFVSIAFSQDGDFIGGEKGAQVLRYYRKGLFYRKVMNSFIFKAGASVKFRGRVNDDVNLYVERGRAGDLFASLPFIRLSQPLTQVMPGGCTEIYREMGTYIKSFYSVIVAPSCVKIAMMGVTNRRIHHNVDWKNCCPMIIDEKYRKPR
jgi:hypothetical protein